MRSFQRILILSIYAIVLIAGRQVVKLPPEQQLWPCLILTASFIAATLLLMKVK